MGICQELFFFFSDFCLILKYVNWSTGGFLKCCFWQRLGEGIEFLHGIMQLTLNETLSQPWMVGTLEFLWSYVSFMRPTELILEQPRYVKLWIFVEIFGKINSFERNKIEIFLLTESVIYVFEIKIRYCVD